MMGSLCRFILVAVVLATIYDVCLSIQCTYTDPKSGKLYNLTSLIASNGSYVWTTPIYTINDFSVDSLIADAKYNYTFQLQVCQNIPKPISAKCTTQGAAYMIDSKGNCTTFGNGDVGAFDLNPYNDGVFLQLYHGSVVDHFSKFSMNVYFVCDKTTPMKPPIFEHLKSPPINQAHFKIFTSYACK